MLTTADRVIAKLTLQHPTADAPSVAASDDAAQFAAQLLENYRCQLSRRLVADPSPQSNASPSRI
jgi:hypothetical protein